MEYNKNDIDVSLLYFLVGVTMNGHKKDLNERFNNNDDSLGRNYRLHVGKIEKRWCYDK